MKVILNIINMKEERAKMKDPIRSFFTEAEAIEFCNQSTAMNLIVERNIFSGKFDVYDMAAR